MSYYLIQSVYTDKTFSDTKITVDKSSSIDNFNLYYSSSFDIPNLYYKDKHLSSDDDDTSFKLKIRESNSANCKINLVLNNYSRSFWFNEFIFYLV